MEENDQRIINTVVIRFILAHPEIIVIIKYTLYNDIKSTGWIPGTDCDRKSQLKNQGSIVHLRYEYGKRTKW